MQTAARRRLRAGPPAGLVAGTAALAVVLAGCGSSGTKLNGLEKQQPKQVNQAASTGLKNASSVHLAGNEHDTDGETTLDLKFQGKNLSGTITQQGTRVDIVRIGATTYVRTAATNGGKWQKTTAAQSSDLSTITLDSLSKNFFDESPTGAVQKVDLNGAKAVTYKQSDGTTIWVANTGAAVPLQAEKSGTEGGKITFSEYGSDFKIAAPAGATG